MRQKKRRGASKSAGFADEGAAYSVPTQAIKSVQVVELSAGGRIVIPAPMRAALGMKVGDRLAVRLEGDELRIYTQQTAIRRMQERMRPYLPPNAVDEFLKWKRAEAANELAKLDRDFTDE